MKIENEPGHDSYDILNFLTILSDSFKKISYKKKCIIYRSWGSLEIYADEYPTFL